jgi:exodeoxyribonuclease VII small subunit
MVSGEEWSMTKQKPVEELTYEQAFQELKDVVMNLESGELALEDSLALFERGQALSKHCSTLLEDAELKLKELVPDGEGGYSEIDLDLEG